MLCCCFHTEQGPKLLRLVQILHGIWAALDHAPVICTGTRPTSFEEDAMRRFGVLIALLRSSGICLVEQQLFA